VTVTNPSDRTAERVAAIEARLAATSPTPWEPGDVWGWAGLVWNDQDERVWDGTGTRCSYCRNRDPLVRTEVRDINGEEMPAHLHRRVEPWDLDTIVSDGNGGVVVREVPASANHALIVNAPSDIEFLLGLVGELETQLAKARELHQPEPDGLGFRDKPYPDGDGAYGRIDPACPTCGQHDEYAVPWPCATAKALGMTGESGR
jgi:hypothetical protein